MTSNANVEAAIADARASDLPEINRIISRAVMGWPLPQRVKRLALPMLQYDAIDFEHYAGLVCTRETVIGCGLWLNEPLSFGSQYCGGLLHGLYVDPVAQGQGVGRKLLQEVFLRAANAGLDGIVVKAERVSQGFFERSGMELLPQLTPGDYPYRYWKQLGEGGPQVLR
jgi:GNAT superfamily N-acetyltransferase